MIDYISAYKLQIGFYMRLACEADKPRMNAELRVMMTELQLKSKWTKLKTIRDIFISAKRDETSNVNEN